MIEIKESKYDVIKDSKINIKHNKRIILNVGGIKVRHEKKGGRITRRQAKKNII